MLEGPSRIKPNFTRGSDLQTLWNDLVGPWELHLHTRIKAARAAMNGESLFQLPVQFEVDGAENLVVSLPQKTTLPLRTVNVLERKRPRIRRYAANPTPRAQSISTNVETWANAAMNVCLDWGKLMGKLFLESAVAAIAVPSPAHWERVPDFLDTVEEFRWRKFPKEKKSRYKKNDEGLYDRVDKAGEAQPKRRYLRDEKGRAADDAHYTEGEHTFKIDEHQSRKAYNEERLQYLARRLPFTVRLLSATDAIPIFGSDDKLTGLITRSKFSREALLERDYDWEPGPSDAALKKSADEDGEIELYEYWYEWQGHPMVAYSVNGSKATRFKDRETGDLIDAEIDLYEEFGLRQLPVKWAWGLKIENDEKAKMGIPFLWPAIKAITVTEAFLTAKAVHAFTHAFPSYAIEVNPEIMRSHPEIVLEGGKPREQTIKPMTAIMAPGKVTPLTPPSTGGDVDSIVRLLMQSWMSLGQNDLPFGGGDATSGHDRALSRDYLESSMSQALQSGLEVYEFVAEMLIQSAIGITERWDVLVPVYANVPVPQTGFGKEKIQSNRKIVEFDPDWVGDITQVDAYYPRTAAENIAMVTTYAQLYKEGLMTFYEFREKALGDESPEATQIAIWIDIQLKTDEGRALIAQLASEMLGSDIDEEMQRLIDRGLMTEDGTPTAALIDEPVNDSRARALEFYANKAWAHGQLAGAGPFGPAAGPVPATAPSAAAAGMPVAGGMPVGAFSGPQTGPHPSAPAPPGTPNASPMIGARTGELGNMVTGGVVAGELGTASTRRDEIARAQQGIGEL